MMKYFSLLFCALVCGALCGADFTVTLEPARVESGDFCQLVVTSTKSARIDIGRPVIRNGTLMPGKSQSSRWINGRGTFSVRYFVRAGQPGKLEIPSFKIKIDGAEHATNALTAEVVAATVRPASRGANATARGTRSGKSAAAANAGSAIALSQAVFGRGSVGSGRGACYENEEIPIELALYVLPDLGIELRHYPELAIPGALFRDFGQVNPENGRFEPIPRTPEFQTVDGRKYQVIRFRAAFRMLKPGKCTPSGSITVMVPENNSRRSRPGWDDDDDFFGSFFTRIERRLVPHKVAFSFAQVPVIRPLPAPPTGALDLKLVGDWSLTGRLDATKVRAAEPFTFELTAAGTGSGDGFAAPRIELAGARVYPPEIVRGAPGSLKRVITVRYVIVPLKEGELKLDFAFAAFDSAAGKYQGYRFERTLPVAPPERAAAPVTIDNAAAKIDAAKSPPPAETPEARPRAREHILYCKAPSPTFGAIDLPHHPLVWFWIAALIAGPLLLILTAGFDAARLSIASSESASRKLQALKRRSPMLKKLRNAGPGTFEEVIAAEVVPYCCDLYNLPYGLSAQELAEQLGTRNPELAAALNRAAADRFMPGAETFDAAGRKAFYRAVKALTIICISLLSALPAHAASHAADRTKVRDLYDQGKFTEAVRLGEAIDSADIAQRRADARLRYNLGCAYVQQGDLPRALVRFEQARKLAPRDSETLENLNFVRRKLALPEVGATDTPSHLFATLRASFTTAEYLTLGTLLYLAIFVLLALRKKLNAPLFRWLASMLLALLILTAAGALSRPRSDQGVILAEAKLRSLPSAVNGRDEGNLAAGTVVEIREKRRDFVLIGSGNASGWIKAAEIMPFGT